jgi:Cu(I)/Ag(I) efflux system membrane fusion protein
MLPALKPLIMKKIFLVAVVLLSFAFVFTACNSSDNKENTSTSTDKKELLAKDEMYTCTMHNEVVSDHPGECPKCGMKLVKQKMTAEQEKMMKEGTYVKPKE